MRILLISCGAGSLVAFCLRLVATFYMSNLLYYTAARLGCWLSPVNRCQCFIASFTARQYADFSRLCADPPFNLLCIRIPSSAAAHSGITLSLSSTSGRVLGSPTETGP
jgi:hypothetical protein